MNSRQKELLARSIKKETETLAQLKQNYVEALADVKHNIKALQADPLTQSRAYRLDFQKQLEKQLSGYIDILNSKNYESVVSYLNDCYNQGIIGTVYDLQGQGVPLLVPIDQNAVVDTLLKTGDDIKLSAKLGNSDELKHKIISELQRGFSTAMPYADIARNISACAQSDLNRSMRIARTEGHRVQITAQLSAMEESKKQGADTVKQWCSVLDSRTRSDHAELDGQIRELDEDFIYSGGTVEAPGMFGIAAQDCNCRCALLERARWAVKDETTHQMWNNETGGIIECSGYDDFKEKYLNALNESNIIKVNKNGIKIDMQFFAEKDIQNQGSNSLKRAICNYNKRIDEHEDKILNPQKYVADWNNKSDQYKQGIIKHWRKEQSNFEESINNRIDELKKRGDYDE